MESNTPLKLIVAGIVGVCTIILFFSTYYTVGQYERGVLTRFGKVVDVSEPGLHFKVPFVNSVHMYRTDILSLSTPKELNGGTGVSTYTVDNQEVHVVFTVQYRLHADKVAFIYENVQDLQARLFQIAEDRLKAEFGKVNTMHSHTMPWDDTPLPMHNLLGGDEGLNDSGVSVSKLIMNPFMFLEATGEIYNGDDDLFTSYKRSDLAYVGRLRGYRDVSESMNLDLGTSFAYGHNDNEERLTTRVFGIVGRAVILSTVTLVILAVPPLVRRSMRLSFR